MTREEYINRRAALETKRMRCVEEGSINCAALYAERIEQLQREWGSLLLAEESANRESLIANHKACISMLEDVLLLAGLTGGRDVIDPETQKEIQTLIDEHERLRK